MNYHRKPILVPFLLLFCFCSFSQINVEKEIKALNKPKLQWWKDARFGMFIHWGPVTLTGKEIGWSRPSTGNAKYDSLYLRFNPKDFDAKKWVLLAKNAGMKYIVFTAKHMDGFCNWDTKTTNYNIMNSPFKRDICKELSDAAHQVGMPICWYFIPPDWKDEACRNPIAFKTFENRVLTQLTELLTNYGKISLLWTDYDGFAPPVIASKVYQLANKLQPGIIVNNRLDVFHTDESHSYIGPNGDYATPEGFVAGYGNIPWETCTNLGHQWAWKFNDQPRPINDAASLLLKCVGGNGNLLLNVGPDSLGVMPEAFENRLNELGTWIKPIERSIYGTKAGPYAPSSNIVCTSKDYSIFLHVLKPEKDTIILPPLNAQIVSAKILNENEILFIQTSQFLKLVIPLNQYNSIATTIELKLNKEASKIAIIPAFSSTGSLAYQKKAIASSSVGQFLHDPSAAFDDNPNSAWVIGRRRNVNIDKYYGTRLHYINSKKEMSEIFDSTGWLQVDLGREQLIGRIKLSERIFNFSKIVDFEVQYKKNNQWVTWVRDSKMGEWEKSLDPISARYFRLVINKREYMSGISEFQLFPPKVYLN